MKNLWIVMALAVCAAAQDREAPPALGTPKPFAVPAGDSFTLKNGMKVTLSEYGSVPLVTVQATLNSGRANESADQVWLSNLTMQMMREGTQSKTAAEIANEAARMGGQLQVVPGTDQSTVTLDVLGEFAADAVKLIADVLQHPRLPESELDRVRNDALRQLSVQLATPGAIANQAFAAQMFPNHPYGRLYPAESRLKGYTLADVRKFYTDNLGAQRTHLYVVGRFDASVKKIIAAAFENWTPGPSVQHPSTAPAVTGELVMVDRPDAVQSTLRIGQKLPVSPGDKDYLPLQVTNTLLGGSFTSRITNNIREQKGYTYSPFSNVTYRYHTSWWQESADVTTQHTGDSVREIVGEIDRLRKEPPSAAELKGTQNYMNGIFVLQNTSNNGIVGQLSFLDLHGLGDDFLKTYIAKINAVTREDVQRVTETYLNPSKMTYVVVGDKAKVSDSVKPYPPKQP